VYNLLLPLRELLIEHVLATIGVRQDPSTPSRELLSHWFNHALNKPFPNPFTDPRQRAYPLLMPTIRKASNDLAITVPEKLWRVIQFPNTVEPLAVLKMP